MRLLYYKRLEELYTSRLLKYSPAHSSGTGQQPRSSYF